MEENAGLGETGALPGDRLGPGRRDKCRHPCEGSLLSRYVGAWFPDSELSKLKSQLRLLLLCCFGQARAPCLDNGTISAHDGGH